jgi:predicted HTH domain antitoxin
MLETRYRERMNRKPMDEFVKVRLTRQEKAAFSRAAELSGVTLSAWLRLRLREAAERELLARGLPVTFLDTGVDDHKRKG